MVLEEFEADERGGEEGDVGICHALPEKAEVSVQGTHAIRTSWPPEATLVYPIQGETIEQRGVLLVGAHLDEFTFPVFVGLLEDREDRPPSNPVQAYPQAISWVLGFEEK